MPTFEGRKRQVDAKYGRGAQPFSMTYEQSSSCTEAPYVVHPAPKLGYPRQVYFSTISYYARHSYPTTNTTLHEIRVIARSFCLRHWDLMLYEKNNPPVAKTLKQSKAHRLKGSIEL